MQKSDSVKAAAQLAAEPALADVMRWFIAEKRWIHERHFELCRIAAPTCSRSRPAPSGWWPSSRRWAAKPSSIARNVLAYVNGDPGGALVALTAHLDTVLEPRTPEDIRGGRDGELLGPGCSDSRWGLAAFSPALAQAFRANRALRASRLPLVLVANVGEEGEGNLNGMRYLCRASGMGSRIRSFLVLDGPGDRSHHLPRAGQPPLRGDLHRSGWTFLERLVFCNPVHTLARAIAFLLE